MNELLPPLPTPLFDPKRLMASFFQNKSKTTLRAYARDLQSFGEFLQLTDLQEATRYFLGSTLGHANQTALDFRAYLLEKDLAPTTINRRLSALRSLSQLARVIGLVPFVVEVRGLETAPLRDTRGPGEEGIEEMFALVQARQDKKGKRDYAILRIMFDLALRRAELCSLKLEHLDLNRSTLSIIGKGRHQRQLLTLPDETREAIQEWLKVRGASPGALFVALDPSAYGKPLTADGLYSILKKLGDKIGRKVRPHGIRHAAITAALDATDGNLRVVQKFSRHKSLDMLLIYDDAREDFQGQVSKLLAKGKKKRT